jgi:chromate transporter
MKASSVQYGPRTPSSPVQQTAILDSRLERGSALEVLIIFLRLGLTCFGGPIAHVGYFREEFVVRRRWIDEAAYADLVALSQFLPGPASSKVGFGIGLRRSGLLGGLAAWTGFTMPSAILMVLFAYGVDTFRGQTGMGLIHGLKLVAVAIVAQAVWGMARTLCPDRPRASIALGVSLIILFNTQWFAQILAIILGGVGGLLFCRADTPTATRGILVAVSRTTGTIALVSYFLLLAVLPLLHGTSHALALFDAFYRSGALVFGGGHVVLPLLHSTFVSSGWVSNSDFLSGYGAAQAVPGPLFSFAAFLGTIVSPSPHRLVGATLGLVGIFLPGMLILVGALPFWDALRQRPRAQAAMLGVNAAVVGILGAALYNTLWRSAVITTSDFGIVLAGFILLTVWRTPPLIIVLLCAVGGVLFVGPSHMIAHP